MSNAHPHPCIDDVIADAWTAYAVAALARDSLTFHGAGSAHDLKLAVSTAEAILLGLDQIVALTRAIATAAAGISPLPPRYPAADQG